MPLTAMASDCSVPQTSKNDDDGYYSMKKIDMEVNGNENNEAQ